MVPPSDKVNNLIFRLQNQARLLHLIAHIFKTTPIYIVFSALQCHVVLNMTIKFTVINCLTQNSATCWKKTTRFSLIKNQVAPSSLPASLCQSKRYEKLTTQTSFFHLRIRLLSLRFCWKMHLRQCRHALIPCIAVRYFTTPHCIPSLHQSQSLLLFKQTVDGLYPPIFRHTAIVNSIQQSVQTGYA